MGFFILDRLPRRMTVQVGLLGLVGGSIMGILRRAQGEVSKRIDQQSSSSSPS